MRRVLSLSVVALALPLGCAATPAAAPRATASPPVASTALDDAVLRELAPSVWLHTSVHRMADGARISSNGLVVRDGAAAVLVDTAWGDAPTARLLAQIDVTLHLPVVRAIATHFHADRVGGALTLASRGIPLVTLPATRELAAPTLVPHALAALREALPPLAIGEATRQGALEVFYPGPAHAPDNVVVWIPAARVLFGGCAVKSADSRTLGNIADADVRAWPDAIRRLQSRYPEATIVVPGHGTPGDLGLLAHTLSLLAAAPPQR